MRYSALRLQRGDHKITDVVPTFVTRDGRITSVNAVEERRIVGYKQEAEVDGMIYMFKHEYEKPEIVLIPEIHPIFNGGMFYMDNMFYGPPEKTFPFQPCLQTKDLMIKTCKDAFDDKLKKGL